jgi:hypothetical protein
MQLNMAEAEQKPAAEGTITIRVKDQVRMTLAPAS